MHCLIIILAIRHASQSAHGLEGGGKVQEEVSPLEVHFSQHVIYPLFSDGTSVDETVREVKAIECDEDEDSCWLRAPFPTIQAVRWCPKLRDGEGKPVLDENGEERRGVEGLFTLDNRRLYVLQRAAVYHYPRKCKISVEVITERWEVLHHLKKFRTRRTLKKLVIRRSLVESLEQLLSGMERAGTTRSTSTFCAFGIGGQRFQGLRMVGRLNRSRLPRLLMLGIAAAGSTWTRNRSVAGPTATGRCNSGGITRCFRVNCRFDPFSQRQVLERETAGKTSGQ
ncbi:unnamed protein product [Cladocopium goreaui]|uniref:Uncharacterized protein n=1 Tax=Cladocopium goreaui TaxID=2562237 RepID=A0A9P1FQC0_9DINO|nr:unnamed protein product [Cladocopium goreaui]